MTGKNIKADKKDNSGKPDGINDLWMLNRMLRFRRGVSNFRRAMAITVITMFFLMALCFFSDSREGNFFFFNPLPLLAIFFLSGLIFWGVMEYLIYRQKRLMTPAFAHQAENRTTGSRAKGIYDGRGELRKTDKDFQEFIRQNKERRLAKKRRKRLAIIAVAGVSVLIIIIFCV